MEEVLNSIDSINKIKYELQKEIYEKFKCKINPNSIELTIISTEDTNLFSLKDLANNEEFNKLFKKINYLYSLFDSIINFRKKLEED